jgi:hypothetical protein
VRKLAGVLGGLLVVGVGAPFGAHALAAQKTDTTCVTVPVVNQTECAPETPKLPDLPTPPNVPVPPAPGLPQLPGPPQLPAPPSLPQLPAPPPLPVPNVPLPLPQVPSVPQLGGTSGAALGSGCAFNSARTSPPPAGEQAVTLPDGTVIYRYMTGDPTTGISGYLGGTNSLGTLEGSGSASPSGVSGQIGGHNNQTGLDGYIGTDGACLNGNSLP